MKSPLSWIRWKYVIPLLIIIAGIVVFFVVFFDPLFARAIEKIGGKINGAKVDVAALKTKIFQGRISIGNLQIANPDRPMQNQIEAGPMAFQLEFGNLISRRMVINEATLSGLAFNTPRKTSGALPKVAKAKKENEPPSAAEKLVEKYKDRFKLNIDGIKGDVKAKIEFDPKDLELVKNAETIKQKAETLPGEWEKRVKDLDVENRLKKAEAEIKTIKETPVSGTNAITAVPEALKKANQVKSDLEALKKDVQTTQSEIQSEAKGLKSDVGGLPGAKKRDLDDLMSRFNMDFASPDRLIEGMIGPLVLDKFKTVFHYVQLARQHMPSKKEKESLPPKPRAKGMDIEFPTPAAPPRFWLMKAALDGTYESISASGQLTDLTTDPARIGKPFKIDMKGSQGRQTFLANAVLNHTTDINKDSLVFQADGLSVSKLFSSSGIADFKDGVGSVELALNLIGTENIGGQLGLSLSGLKFDDPSLLKKVGIENAASVSGGDKLKADFMLNVARAIESMKEVAVNAQILGTWTDPNLKITSNLGSVLSNVIKDSVGNLVKDQRKQVEAKLDQILADQQKQVNEKVEGIDRKVNSQLSEIEAKIQQKISEATGIDLSGGENGSPIPGLKVPSLNKLFKK